MSLDELDALVAHLEALPGALTRAAAAAAPELLAVVKAEHAAGQAPDGTPWPLTKKGAVALTSLTSQTTARAEGASIVLELDDKLRPHQAGGGHDPRRQLVPEPGEPLPPSWEKPLAEAIAGELAGA